MTLIDYSSFDCLSIFLHFIFFLSLVAFILPNLCGACHFNCTSTLARITTPRELCAEKRVEFERRRKLHYNEFEAVRLARQLMEEDELEDETIEVDESHAAS